MKQLAAVLRRVGKVGVGGHLPNSPGTPSAASPEEQAGPPPVHGGLSTARTQGAATQRGVGQAGPLQKKWLPMPEAEQKARGDGARRTRAAHNPARSWPGGEARAPEDRTAWQANGLGALLGREPCGKSLASPVGGRGSASCAGRPGSGPCPLGPAPASVHDGWWCAACG